MVVTFVWVLLALSLWGTALVYWLWISVRSQTPLNRANAFSFLISIFGLTIGACSIARPWGGRS